MKKRGSLHALLAFKLDKHSQLIRYVPMRMLCSLIVLLSLLVSPFMALTAYANDNAAHEYVLKADCCDQTTDSEKGDTADCSLHCSLCTPAAFNNQNIRVLEFKESIKIRFFETLSPDADALKGVFEPPKRA